MMFIAFWVMAIYVMGWMIYAGFSLAALLWAGFFG
jgi:hypothetical protein